MAIGFNHGNCAANILVLHIPLRHHGQAFYIDASFTVTHDVSVRWFVIGGVDHEARPMVSENRGHFTKITK